MNRRHLLLRSTQDNTESAASGHRGSGVDALRNHRTRQLEERLVAGPAWRDEDLVFSTISAGRSAAITCLVATSRALKRAGLPRIRFHDLRHTCATLLLRRGVHPKVVSELLGHSTVTMTLDRYSHVLPDMQAGGGGGNGWTARLRIARVRQMPFWSGFYAGCRHGCRQMAILGQCWKRWKRKKPLAIWHSGFCGP